MYSKFLWLKFQSPIYIYDSLTVAALKVKKDRMPKFRSAWLESFNENREKIQNACEKLPEVQRYSSEPNLGREEIIKLSKERWFEERVHDFYLMDLGRVKSVTNY